LCFQSFSPEKIKNMKKFIKESWFKILLLIAIFIFISLQFGAYNIQRVNGKYNCVSVIASNSESFSDQQTTSTFLNTCMDSYSKRNLLFQWPF